MKITKKTTIINGQEKVTFIYEGREYSDITRLLYESFINQGAFYEKVLGVSTRDAQIAGWDPDKDNFEWEGWQKMLADGGIVRKTVTEEIVDVRDILFPARNEEDENDE